MIKCRECKNTYSFDKFTYYSKMLGQMHVGKKCVNCRLGWALELKVKSGIKKLMTEKYPDIINEIYETED